MNDLTLFLDDFAKRIETESEGYLVVSPDKACQLHNDEALVCMYDVDISIRTLRRVLTLSIYYGPYGNDLRITVSYEPLIEEPVFKRFIDRWYYNDSNKLALEAQCVIRVNKDISTEDFMCEIAKAITEAMWAIKDDIDRPHIHPASDRNYL